MRDCGEVLRALIYIPLIMGLSMIGTGIVTVIIKCIFKITCKVYDLLPAIGQSIFKWGLLGITVLALGVYAPSVLILLGVLFLPGIIHDLFHKEEIAPSSPPEQNNKTVLSEVPKHIEQFREAERPPAPVVKVPSPAELAQTTLDEFWAREKTDAEIGKLYEQYIGYLHEKIGCEVEYYGIEHGLNDLGRDLICRKDGHTWVVQCKNWSKSKMIYVKYIHQLYGTSVQYAAEHPDESVLYISEQETHLHGVLAPPSRGKRSTVTDERATLIDKRHFALTA